MRESNPLVKTKQIENCFLVLLHLQLQGKAITPLQTSDNQQPTITNQIISQRTHSPLTPITSTKINKFV